MENVGDQAQPLEGIRVLDLGRIYQGPYCGLLLALAGAEVIKIEAPEGDPLRRRGSRRGPPAQFVMLNADKLGMTLDLKTDEGRELLLGLVDHADVILENFAPGVMDGLGLGAEVLQARNPRLVYASGSGYGLSGPDRDRLAMDVTVQAYLGVMSVTGDENMPPLKAGAQFIDILGGVHLYAGIATALYEREKTGVGRIVETAMAEATFFTLSSSLGAFFDMGTVPRTGNRHNGLAIAPYNVYETSDGHVAIITVTEKHWRNLATAMGRPELGEDERYATNKERAARMEEVDALVEAWTRTLTRAEVFAIAQEAHIAAAPVRTLDEVVDDPHLHARKLLHWAEETEAGRVVLAQSPITYAGTPRHEPRPGPRHGEHTDQVLSEVLGLDDEAIERLREQGAIGAPQASSSDSSG